MYEELLTQAEIQGNINKVNSEYGPAPGACGANTGSRVSLRLTVRHSGVSCRAQSLRQPALPGAVGPQPRAGLCGWVPSSTL